MLQRRVRPVTNNVVMAQFNLHEEDKTVNSVSWKKTLAGIVVLLIVALTIALLPIVIS